MYTADLCALSIPIQMRAPQVGYGKRYRSGPPVRTAAADASLPLFSGGIVGGDGVVLVVVGAGISESAF